METDETRAFSRGDVGAEVCPRCWEQGRKKVMMRRVPDPKFANTPRPSNVTRLPEMWRCPECGYEIPIPCPGFEVKELKDE
jgi:hypothetical protein